MKTIQKILSDLWALILAITTCAAIFAILVGIGIRLWPWPQAFGIYSAFTLFATIWTCSRFKFLKTNMYATLETLGGKAMGVLSGNVFGMHQNNPTDIENYDPRYPKDWLIPTKEELITREDGKVEKIITFGPPGYEQDDTLYEIDSEFPEDGAEIPPLPPPPKRIIPREEMRVLVTHKSFLRDKVGVEFIGLFRRFRRMDTVLTKFVPADSVMAKITGYTPEYAEEVEGQASKARQAGTYAEWQEHNCLIYPDRDDFGQDWQLRWHSHSWLKREERLLNGGQQWAIIVQTTQEEWVPVITYIEVVVTGADTGIPRDKNNKEIEGAKPEMIPIALPIQCVIQIVNPLFLLSRMSDILNLFESTMSSIVQEFVKSIGGIDNLEMAHFSETNGRFKRFLLKQNGRWVKSNPNNPTDQNYELTDGLMKKYGFMILPATNVRDWHPATKEAERALNSRINTFNANQEATQQGIIGKGIGDRYYQEMAGKAKGQAEFYDKVGASVEKYRKHLREGGVHPDVEAQSNAIGKLTYLSIGGKNGATPFIDINKIVNETSLPKIDLSEAEKTTPSTHTHEEGGDGHSSEHGHGHEKESHTADSHKDTDDTDNKDSGHETDTSSHH